MLSSMSHLLTLSFFTLTACSGKLSVTGKSGSQPPSEPVPPTEPQTPGVEISIGSYDLDLTIAGSLAGVEDSNHTLTASITNMKEGDLPLYQWTLAGSRAGLPANVKKPELNLTLPESEANYDIVYNLKVTTAMGGIAERDIVLTVTADNDAPVADAGPDKTVAELTSVMLSGGKSSDRDSPVLSYKWTQVSGPPVTLSSEDTVTAGFTAPDRAQDYNLVFQLIVNDGSTSSQPDQVSIQVTAQNQNLIPESIRGYHPRSCGFDMNRDGITGTPEDCRVCDGKTTDPDGDGLPEDIWYVHATTGVDSTDCGSAGTPCKSIQYTMNLTDGPSVGQEDIICIAGTFSESVSKEVSGKAEFYSFESFQRPKHPFMLVGWDRDGDGSYPPYDADDEAVINGTGGGNHFWNAAATSYMEMAHFSVRNINSPGNFDAGVLYLDSASTNRSHLIVHDIEVDGVNDGAADGYIFNAGNESHNVSWVAIENVKATRFGSGFFYLNNQTYTAANFRISNNTLEPKGTPGSSWYPMIHAVGVQDLALTRNNIDVKWSAWTPARTVFLNLGQCSKRVSMVENRLWEVTQALNAFVDTQTCTPETSIDDVLISRNDIAVQGDQSAAIALGYRAPGSVDNLVYTFEDLTVENNVIHKLAGSTAEWCVQSTASNGVGVNPGRYAVLANTCVGFGVFAGNPDAGTYSQSDIHIRNNIIHDVPSTKYTTMVFADLGGPPAGFIASNNTYDPTSKWFWISADRSTLTLWEGASGDSASATCVPSFVDKTNRNFRLRPEDTCAKGKGAGLSGIDKDFSGAPYPAVTPNTGAYQ